MLTTTDFYNYMMDKTWELTEQWYDSLDKSLEGVYSTTDPVSIEELKRQNHEFHVRFFEIFQTKHDQFGDQFQDWLHEVSHDEAHLSTPIHAIIQEFFHVQKQYLNMLQSFITENREQVSIGEAERWSRMIIETVNEIVMRFSRLYAQASEARLLAQQELIVQLSSPVILLAKETGLLPLVGEINTFRAQIISEKTMQQAQKQNLQLLFIDLSGVPIVDTMVAQELFKLIDGLKMLGVKTALSGVRPEIAQTAVQLGISFKGIDVFSTLANAIATEEIF